MHAHNAWYREDAFAWEIGEGFFIAAVSDGAGSCEWSRIGSTATTIEITKRLRDWLSAERRNLDKLGQETFIKTISCKITDVIGDIKWFIEDIASKSGTKPKEFRCTLLLTVWCRTTSGEALFTTQVGDGFFGMLRRDGRAQRHGESDSGDFSGEVTSFIPDANAVEHAKIALKSHVSDEIEAVMMCSDGVEDPFYPLKKNSALIFRELYFGVPEPLTNAADVKHNGFIDPILAERGHEALSNWLAFEKRGENDDRTIVVIRRDPGTPPASIHSEMPNA